ncbi:UNVERIFIED_CONTAM: putative WRKY transcription factor 65 [Sesamum angustifolium]|uniref:WRKY transcription factor 65 n=1 Tax=Sesamum angustifolium TaxID=2727405 RepID=A0AAW2P9X9_9LAMI
MLESPILTEDRITTDNEMAMIFTMREEDESLFADLGELPECSTVFRRGMAQRDAEQRRPGLATTG